MDNKNNNINNDNNNNNEKKIGGSDALSSLNKQGVLNLDDDDTIDVVGMPKQR